VKYIEAIGLPRNWQNAFECDALLEMKLVPLSMLSNGFPCARPDIPGNRCRESTSALTT
jgi:hypothetical protein